MKKISLLSQCHFSVFREIDQMVPFHFHFFRPYGEGNQFQSVHIWGGGGSQSRRGVTRSSLGLVPDLDGGGETRSSLGRGGSPTFTPSRGGTPSPGGCPISGYPPPGIKHLLWLRGGRCALCVHARGLSCFCMSQLHPALPYLIDFQLLGYPTIIYLS